MTKGGPSGPPGLSLLRAADAGTAPRYTESGTLVVESGCVRLRRADRFERSRIYPVVFGLLAATGMRIGELLALDDEEVDLDAGIMLAALAHDAGLAGSRGEARRLAQGGGLRVNDAAEADAGRTITAADLVDGVVKLAAGKKKIVLVKPV